MSDVPVGAYLSGGMDSASLVTLAGNYIPHIHTFTVGFDVTDASPLEVAADERADAELVARNVGTEHYEAVLHAGDMARVLPQLVWHLEDLRAGTCYQNFYVARLASRFTKVVLAGTGGDELFAGYPWRYARLEGVATVRSFLDAYYEYWCRLVPDDEKPSLFTDAVRDELQGFSTPRDRFEEVTAHLPELEPIDAALYFEQRTFLHGLLVVEDKLSMAHGLEARVPVPRQRAGGLRVAHSGPRAETARARARSCCARRRGDYCPSASSTSPSRASALPTAPGTRDAISATCARCSSTPPHSRVACSARATSSA